MKQSGFADTGYRNPQRLATLAHVAFSDKTGPGEKAAETLRICIDRLLSERRDEVLFRAGDAVQEKYGDTDLVNFLVGSIQLCAQTRSVQNGLFDLFAVPFYVQGDAWRAMGIQDPTSFTALSKLFRRCGMIGLEPSLILLPQIFTASQLLDLAWSDVRNSLVGGSLRALVKNEVWQPMLPDDEPRPAVYGTRFLVGAVLSSSEAMVPFLFGGDDQSEGLPDACLERWIEQANPLLSAAFGTEDAVEVGMPMDYFSALSVGIPHSGVMLLEDGVAALARAGIVKQGLRAVTSYHSKSSGLREIRVAIESILDGMTQISVGINLPPAALSNDFLAMDCVTDAIVGCAAAVVNIGGDEQLDDMACDCGGAMVFKSSGEAYCPACAADPAARHAQALQTSPSQSRLH